MGDTIVREFRGRGRSDPTTTLRYRLKGREDRVIGVSGPIHYHQLVKERAHVKRKACSDLSSVSLAYRWLRRRSR